MNKFILILLIFLLGQTSFAQTLPTFTKPKEAKPKATKPKPKAAPVKTKIIYVDRSVPSSTTQETTTITTKSFEPEMVFVQGGSFSMGSNKSDDEKPIHTVTVSSFKMSKYEVTVGQYKAYCSATGTAMPKAPDWGWKDTCAMVNVSYDDAVGYCSWLSEKTGKDYRLPTEAEWEFAARGGTQTNYYPYSGSDNIDAVAWYAGNSGSEIHEVGGKRPNELGLYDMTGNAWEWCKDWYAYKNYTISPSSNPEGPFSGTWRVNRGGSWYHNADILRVTYRRSSLPSVRVNDMGFRVVSP